MELLQSSANGQNNPTFSEKSVKDLSRNGFTEFPVGHLPAESREKILMLQLHHNNIGFIPDVIETFSQLVVLDISSNGLSHIAEEFGNLRNLQTLVAKNNCLDNDSVPKTLDQLRSLKDINFGGNNLTEFPPQLVHMPSVEKLYLGSNRIKEIPNTIQHMNG